jgi:hypothetical protein
MLSRKSMQGKLKKEKVEKEILKKMMRRTLTITQLKKIKMPMNQ